MKKQMLREEKNERKREKRMGSRKREGEFCEMGVKFHMFGWKRMNGFRWVCLGCGRKRDEEDDEFR